MLTDMDKILNDPNTPVASLIARLKALPGRVERIGGQRCTYVAKQEMLDTVADWYAKTQLRGASKSIVVLDPIAFNNEPANDDNQDNLDWQTTAPTIKGTWLLRDGSDDKPDEVRVYSGEGKRRGVLWCDSCVGTMPVQQLHDGLGDPQWALR